jgi:hypothetical protein
MPKTRIPFRASWSLSARIFCRSAWSRGRDWPLSQMWLETASKLSTLPLVKAIAGGIAQGVHNSETRRSRTSGNGVGEAAVDAPSSCACDRPRRGVRPRGAGLVLGWLCSAPSGRRSSPVPLPWDRPPYGPDGESGDGVPGWRRCTRWPRQQPGQGRFGLQQIDRSS